MKRSLGFFLLAGSLFALALSSCGGGGSGGGSGGGTAACKPSAPVQQIAAQKSSPVVVPFPGINSVSTVRILMGGANQGTALNTNGYVTTLAGSAGVSGSTDGTGTVARFNHPSVVSQ